MIVKVIYQSIYYGYLYIQVIAQQTQKWMHLFTNPSYRDEQHAMLRNEICHQDGGGFASEMRKTQYYWVCRELAFNLY